MQGENALEAKYTLNIKIMMAFESMDMGLIIQIGFAVGIEIKLMSIFKTLESSSTKKTNSENMLKLSMSLKSGMD